MATDIVRVDRAISNTQFADAAGHPLFMEWLTLEMSARLPETSVPAMHAALQTAIQRTVAELAQPVS